MSKNFTSILKSTGLYSKYYRKPGFGCSWYPSGDKVDLDIYLGAQSIHICFTKHQWKNFKNFLEKTIAQKEFQKDHQGFEGFDIIKNKIFYYNHTIEEKILRIPKENTGPQLTKKLAKLKRIMKKVLRTGLTNDLSIICNPITVTIERKAFYSLRKVILQKNEDGTNSK